MLHRRCLTFARQQVGLGWLVRSPSARQKVYDLAKLILHMHVCSIGRP